MWKKTALLTLSLVSLLVVCVASAHADHPYRSRSHTRVDVSRLERMSHRLERSVQRLRREATRCTDERRHREHRALHRLHVLEKRASRFRKLVERRPGALSRLIADFRGVDESFRVARTRVRHLRLRHLRYEFQRVGSLVAELEGELQRKLWLARHGDPGHVGHHSRHSNHRQFSRRS